MAAELDLAAFDYVLPPERIAQRPAPEREAARLLVLERASGRLAHRIVRDLPELLRPGDLLVVNATRVLAARLRGRKTSGGAAEALLLGPDPAPGARAAVRLRALVACRGRLRLGPKLVLGGLDAEVAALGERGEVVLAFPAGSDPWAAGETPLPPYIRREAPRAEDVERYQTVYARVPGSIAAPTAGLHLGEPLLARLRAAGVALAELVLHVGPGTFRPLAAEDLRRGRLHPEAFELPAETAAAVARTRAAGGRVLAVGTTAARVLESQARPDGSVAPGAGDTELFLRPPRTDETLPFRGVDALLTNFHLPRSSLLLLVAAFASRRRVLDAYAEAIRAGYRFYSYGDAMLVV